MYIRETIGVVGPPAHFAEDRERIYWRNASRLLRI